MRILPKLSKKYFTGNIINESSCFGVIIRYMYDSSADHGHSLTNIICSWLIMKFAGSRNLKSTWSFSNFTKNCIESKILAKPDAADENFSPSRVLDFMICKQYSIRHVTFNRTLRCVVKRSLISSSL